MAEMIPIIFVFFTSVDVCFVSVPIICFLWVCFSPCNIYFMLNLWLYDIVRPVTKKGNSNEQLVHQGNSRPRIWYVYSRKDKVGTSSIKWRGSKRLRLLTVSWLYGVECELRGILRIEKLVWVASYRSLVLCHIWGSVPICNSFIIHQ